MFVFRFSSREARFTDYLIFQANRKIPARGKR